MPGGLVVSVTHARWYGLLLPSGLTGFQPPPRCRLTLIGGLNRRRFQALTKNSNRLV